MYDLVRFALKLRTQITHIFSKLIIDSILPEQRCEGRWETSTVLLGSKGTLGRFQICIKDSTIKVLHEAHVNRGYAANSCKKIFPASAEIFRN